MRRSFTKCLLGTGCAFMLLMVGSSRADAPCEDCGPGPHWVDGCAPGSDTMNSSALVGIDTTLDCQADTIVVLDGPITVNRTGPLPASVQFPAVTGPGGHGGPDVIDTEMVSMSLTGGGLTLQAGTAAGMNAGTATCNAPGTGLVPKSCGAIAETAADPTMASSFFEVYFRVDLGGGTFVYNHQPLRVNATIGCVPPIADYIKTIGCLNLFNAPVGAGGMVVANLTSASHNTFPQYLVAITALYSNSTDEMAVAGGGAHNGPDTEQVLLTILPDVAGAPLPADGPDYSGAGQVDALANRWDAYFFSLLTNRVDLLVSLQTDPLNPPGNAVYFEDPLGATGLKWSQGNFSNPDPAGDVEDIDGLQIWGGAANRYSLVGEPGGTAIFADPGAVPVLTQAAAHAAVAAIAPGGFTGVVGQVDVDGLMVHPLGILFSIRPAANFDGGEIIFLPTIGAPAFLFHGGHLWDTGFNVGLAFGLADLSPADYNVDAIEAVPPKGGPKHVPQGGCCIEGGGCNLETPEGCSDGGGSYQGDGSTCPGGGPYESDGNACGANGTFIPTVSEWGLAVMALLVLTAATVVIMRRRAAVA